MPAITRDYLITQTVSLQFKIRDAAEAGNYADAHAYSCMLRAYQDMLIYEAKP